MGRSRTGAVLLGALASVIGASAAWACTPSADIELPNGTVLQAGGTATVVIRAFNPGPVVIHWDGPGGPVVGRAYGPADSATVDVPDVGPDVYYLVATQSDSRNPTVAVEVAGADATPVTRNAPTAGTSSGEGPAPDAQPASGPATPEAPAHSLSPSSQGEGAGVVGVVARATTEGTVRAPAVVSGQRREAAGPGSASPSPVATAGAEATSGAGGTIGAAPAPRPWSDDVAGGFASGRTAPRLDWSAAGAGSGLPGPAKAGLGLITAGLVGLATAIAVTVRRRRVPVTYRP